MAKTGVQVETSDRAREIRAVALVILLAAVIRLAYFVQYQSLVPYYGITILDAKYYDAWAMRVASGQGYGPMPFYMSPMYPYILAVVYFLTGHGYTQVYVLQMVLGLGNLLLTYAIGRRLFGHKAGLIAMVLMTVYAPLIYLETKILTETIAIALNLIALLLVMRALKRPGYLGFLVAGVTMGLSAVCRPSALVSVGLILVWLTVTNLRTRTGFRFTAVATLGVMIAILPVTARNYVVGHDLVLISSNGGLVFAQSNNPTANGVSSAIEGFSGSIMTQQQEEMSIAAKELGHPVKPSESSSFWMGRALGFIRSEPGVFAKLLAMKTLWAVHNREADCSYNVYLEESLVPALRFLVLPFAVLAGLAVFGFAFGRNIGDAREKSLLAIYAVSVFVGLIIFAVTSRYRVPAVPILCVFAGYGLVHGWDALTGRKVRELIVAGSCVAAFALIGLVPYPIAKISPAAMANLGANYLEIGNSREAMRLLKKALAMDPKQEVVHHNYAGALMLAGDLDGAVREYRRAVELVPENATYRNSLGFALIRKGDASGAEAEFHAAIALKPDDAEAHLGLANSLLMQGRKREAESERKTANRLGPDLAMAHFGLANKLAARKNWDEAVFQYQEAIRLRSDYAEAYVGLGLAYKDQGKLPEAIRAYRDAIRANPGLTKAYNNLAVALYYQQDYAGAWQAVHASLSHGGHPHPGFLQALAEKMEDPGR